MATFEGVDDFASEGSGVDDGIIKLVDLCGIKPLQGAAKREQVTERLPFQELGVKDPDVSFPQLLFDVSQGLSFDRGFG
ncbi:MAG: hypothetical protein OET79_08070, partial [Nitrospirota bacterium]|nr:hypothetical protein [Nitrospirota bacterium]